MAEKRIVLVTGVASEWGGRVATALMNQPDVHVIGLDDKPPEKEINKLDFIQADFRNPVIVQLLREEIVDTVYHLAFSESERPSETAFDLNVVGAMKFIGMCAEGGVRKVILKSSTMVYGAQPSNSMFLREDHALNGNKSYGYIRDLVEMEAFCNGFRGQVPDMIITTLRFAHIIGPKVDTPMSRFLRDEEAFVLLGFDPLMQVIHEDDVVRALVHMMNCDAPGAFNIAAEGTMPLWKLMGLAGKVTAPVFHPLAYTSVSLLGPRYAPIDLDYLRYVCIGDTEKMKSVIEFTPQYTAVEALREFASQQRLHQYMPESVTRASEEERLRDTIERRRRAREQAAVEEQREQQVRAMTVRPIRRRRTKRQTTGTTE